jgi:hypothetical protein
MAKTIVHAADRAAAGQVDQAVTVTLQCELGNCHRCPGQIVSLLVEPGTPCGHDCHRKEVAA